MVMLPARRQSDIGLAWAWAWWQTAQTVSCWHFYPYTTKVSTSQQLRRRRAQRHGSQHKYAPSGMTGTSWSMEQSSCYSSDLGFMAMPGSTRTSPIHWTARCVSRLSTLSHSNHSPARHPSRFPHCCGLCRWPYQQCSRFPGILEYMRLQGTQANFGSWWVDMGWLSVPCRDVVCRTISEAHRRWVVSRSKNLQLSCIKSTSTLHLSFFRFLWFSIARSTSVPNTQSACSKAASRLSVNSIFKSHHPSSINGLSCSFDVVLSFITWSLDLRAGISMQCFVSISTRLVGDTWHQWSLICPTMKTWMAAMANCKRPNDVWRRKGRRFDVTSWHGCSIVHWVGRWGGLGSLFEVKCSVVYRQCEKTWLY